MLGLRGVFEEFGLCQEIPSALIIGRKECFISGSNAGVLETKF